MTTKEEYEKAVKNIKDAFYAKNVNLVLATENFKTNLDFLSGLVNERFEEKAETNLDHYKDDIAELFIDNLAIVDGKPKRCVYTVCDERCDLHTDCDDETHYKLVKEWLKKPYQKQTFKLTQFEYDLLSVYKDYKTYNNIANQIHLFKMHEKGYFKGIDTNIPIREILDNCEVMD